MLAYIISGLIVLVLIAALGLIYYARDFAAPIPPAVPGTIKIACVGDSITYGALVRHRKQNCYPAQLELRLGARYSVRNFGVNGHALQKSADKPYWEHKHFRASSEFLPDIVLIMLGTNDAPDYNWKGIDAFTSDYEAFLDHYTALLSHPVIYMMTPPTQFPVENYTKVIHTMNNDRLDVIADAIKIVAAKHGLSVIDVNAATKTHPEYFKFDGIHPDADGARLIAETAYKTLISKDEQGPIN